MAITTLQQITHYYDQYRDRELTFTKDIIKTLALDPRQVYVKCNGTQWPCIINSTSFMHAKIIIGTKTEAFAEFAKKTVSPINLRFCFIESDGQPNSFMVPCKVGQIGTYMNSTDLAIVTLNFTQRPSDALIEHTGRLLEANDNSIRRRDESIVINDDTKRRLKLSTEKISVNIQNVPRNSVLRELSFGGAKIVLMGLAQFLTHKGVTLTLDFDEPQETLTVKGIITSAEPVEGRKDIVTATIDFSDEDIPLEYKLHINEFITSVHNRQMNNVEQKELLRRQMEARAKLSAAQANLTK